MSLFQQDIFEIEIFVDQICPPICFRDNVSMPWKCDVLFTEKKGNGNMASGCPVSESLGYDFSRTVLTVHNRCVLKIGDCNMLQPGSS